ncbi:hypothetical protein [Micromonospora sp. NPDC049891]|uniref:hypothetical protein n=1 Tax=Micromonospora sp. NPDC049891 TaxID=3155655 RepID=UPI0033C7F034
MTTQLLRLTSATEGRPPLVVPFGQDEMPEVERLRDRLAELELVRAGVRRVEILPAGGAR